MVRLIQTLALGAALVALVSCIWRDYGVLAALPRVAIAYLATFFLGAVVALGARLLSDAAAKPATPPPAAGRKNATRRRQNRAATPPAGEPKAAPSGAEPEAG